MYLQLAENNNDMENYIPIETNQGTIFVRRDLAEDVMLSQKAPGRGLKIASKIVGKVAPNIPIPGAAKVGQIASKVLQKAGDIQSKSGIDTSGIGKGIGAKLKGALSKLKAKGAPAETTALPEAVTRSAVQQEQEFMQPKQTYFQKYSTPLLIGGGVLVLGTAAYLLTRKKKR